MLVDLFDQTDKKLPSIKKKGYIYIPKGIIGGF